MARGQVRRTQIQQTKRPTVQVQSEQMVFAMDIGTRSVIGMVGIVEEGKVRIVAIEKEEHTERAMIDGQIENIEKVSALADKIKKRLEKKVHVKLERVCVAAAGRALRTKRADYEMELQSAQLIDDEVISRLEAGAISKAEEAFDAENEAQEDHRRFYLVGYTVCQYYLDQYMMSSLKDHRGRQVKVDLIATFLPSEVVESLYTTMNKIGLEVASITLEPIAAINAAIPENIRLLNLVMVDIGAGTSDIAACTGGSVTGYTMATVAGDEVTEAIMKGYLVDFSTAETIKAELEQKEEVTFLDILGMEQKVTRAEVEQCIQGAVDLLCKEISEKVLEINGNPPSALFLAGGGSKLAGLKDKITQALKMEASRVAVAGNYFRANAFSDEYDLNDPEYATPLGIALSSGLNLINDSFRVILNGRAAKLFRSGSFTALNLLMMNGYNLRDMLGRPGANLAITVNGRRKVFYGTTGQPASLLINKKEGKLSEIIHAGDSIDFVPAIQGTPAAARLGDVEGASTCLSITLNGRAADLRTPLKNGDAVTIKLPPEEKPEGGETEAKDEAKEETAAGGPETGVKAAASEPGPQPAVSGPGEGPQAVAGEPEAGAQAVLHEAEAGAQAVLHEAEAGTQAIAGDPGTGVQTAVGGPEAGVRATTVGDPEPGVRTTTVGDPEPGVQTTARSVPELSAQAAAGELGIGTGTAAAPLPKDEARPIHRINTDPAPQAELVSGASTAASAVEKTPAGAAVKRKETLFYLNGAPLRLPVKGDGSPYYLMDLLQYSGIDLKNPKGQVKLTVNGRPGMFQQELRERDTVYIQETG